MTHSPIFQFAKLQHDYLLVQLIDDDLASASPNGIVSPYGRHANAPRRGRVLQAGRGYTLPSGERADMCAVVGATILLQLNAGTVVLLDGAEYTLVLDRDIFGVVYP